MNDLTSWIDNGWLIELSKDKDGVYIARASVPSCESDTGIINDVVNGYGSTPHNALCALVKKLRIEKG